MVIWTYLNTQPLFYPRLIRSRERKNQWEERGELGEACMGGCLIYPRLPRMLAPQAPPDLCLHVVQLHGRCAGLGGGEGGMEWVHVVQSSDKGGWTHLEPGEREARGGEGIVWGGSVNALVSQAAQLHGRCADLGGGVGGNEWVHAVRSSDERGQNGRVAASVPVYREEDIACGGGSPAGWPEEPKCMPSN